MDFWLAVMMEGTEHLLDIARAAERLGYTGIVLADHIAVPHGFASVHPSGENPFTERSDFPDPLTSIAAMSAVTTTLRFMPYVYVLPMREPFSVAKQAGTVAMLSQYRLALGVGAGWLREEIELLGVDPRSRGRRMDEMIAIMRQFWTTGTAELHGEHFDFGPASMFPVPTGRIPVWVGGKSPAALARAARNDGWLGMDYDLDEIDRLLPLLADARRRHHDAGGDADAPFETLVIPRALPDRGLYASLQDKGVTSTVCVAWALGEVSELGAKVDAMAAFADAFIAPVAS
jgi:probable F420-dependent oxidoreductase